jgi:mRNA-degrading endonuclease toxin of MazEF toxin-antitoxin module
MRPVNNVSTTIAGSSQNVRGASSTQINGGAPHQLPLQASSPIQVIQGNVNLEQIQVEDWEDEGFKGEAVEEEELAKIQ